MVYDIVLPTLMGYHGISWDIMGLYIYICRVYIYIYMVCWILVRNQGGLKQDPRNIITVTQRWARSTPISRPRGRNWEGRCGTMRDGSRSNCVSVIWVSVSLTDASTILRFYLPHLRWRKPWWLLPDSFPDLRRRTMQPSSLVGGSFAELASGHWLLGLKSLGSSWVSGSEKPLVEPWNTSTVCGSPRLLLCSSTSLVYKYNLLDYPIYSAGFTTHLRIIGWTTKQAPQNPGILCHGKGADHLIATGYMCELEDVLLKTPEIDEAFRRTKVGPISPGKVWLHGAT